MSIDIFDAHLHIIDPRFPLVENQGYLPPSFTCDDYCTATEDYSRVGGAVVSGSFQGFDQSYLIAALKTLGPSYVGVTQLPATASDEEIIKLHRAGVRALRFNLKRGGSEQFNQLECMAARVWELCQWHIELYVDSVFLTELTPTLLSLPAVSIDHLGLSAQGLPQLLQLAEQGVKVKATGFGRVDFDVTQALQDLSLANPDCLMFGTDLPSTRAPRAYCDNDRQRILNALTPEQAERVLFKNAQEFYKSSIQRV
jgi:predicted TIM-barrel fold metal-dependent hydrolase